jgi:hypothetical protein
MIAGAMESWTPAMVERAKLYGICRVCGLPGNVENGVQELPPETGLLGEPVRMHQGKQYVTVSSRLVCPNGHHQSAVTDYDVDEILARIVSVLDPAWDDAARETLDAMIEPILEQLEQLRPQMKPGDTLELVAGRVVIVPKQS